MATNNKVSIVNGGSWSARAYALSDPIPINNLGYRRDVVSNLLCKILGHKFYWKFSADHVTWYTSDFCTRCGWKP